MIEPTPEAGDLMEACIDHALQLVATVHGDGDAGNVAALLASCPQGRWDAVLVALAGMVDPDARVTDLLAWMTPTPAKPTTPAPLVTAARAPHPNALPREHGTPRGWRQHYDRGETACEECTAARTVARRPAQCQQEYARLRAAGVPIGEALGRSTLANLLRDRSRPDLRSVPA